MQIDLSGRGLIDFDASAFSTDVDRAVLRSIARLNLSLNRLSSLHSISVLTFLTSLDISHNSVTSLHGLPPSLRELNASSNALRDLNGVQPLRQLQVLRVAHNSLSHVAALSPLADLRALQFLSLAENAVAQQPACREYLRAALPMSLRVEGLSWASPDVSRETVSLSDASDEPRESAELCTQCAQYAAENAALRKEVRRLQCALAALAPRPRGAPAAGGEENEEKEEKEKEEEVEEVEEETRRGGARFLAARIMSAVAARTDGTAHRRQRSLSASFGGLTHCSPPSPSG